MFNIYVDVHNISKDPINIMDVQLTSPLGFIQHKKDEMPLSYWDRIRGVKIGFTSFEFSAEGFGFKVAPDKFEYSKTPVSTPKTDKSNPRKGTVQPNENFRAEFNLQAGQMLGVIPRPDTYTLSIEVIYDFDSHTS